MKCFKQPISGAGDVEFRLSHEAGMPVDADIDSEALASRRGDVAHVGAVFDFVLLKKSGVGLRSVLYKRVLALIADGGDPHVDDVLLVVHPVVSNNGAAMFKRESKWKVDGASKRRSCVCRAKWFACRQRLPVVPRLQRVAAGR